MTAGHRFRAAGRPAVVPRRLILRLAPIQVGGPRQQIPVGCDCPHPAPGADCLRRTVDEARLNSSTSLLIHCCYPRRDLPRCVDEGSRRGGAPTEDDAPLRISFRRRRRRLARPRPPPVTTTLRTCPIEPGAQTVGIAPVARRAYSQHRPRVTIGRPMVGRPPGAGGQHLRLHALRDHRELYVSYSLESSQAIGR